MSICKDWIGEIINLHGSKHPELLKWRRNKILYQRIKTYIEAQLNKSDGQMNIDKYRETALSDILKFEQTLMPDTGHLYRHFNVIRFDDRAQ